MLGRWTWLVVGYQSKATTKGGSMNLLPFMPKLDDDHLYVLKWLVNPLGADGALMGSEDRSNWHLFPHEKIAEVVSNPNKEILFASYDWLAKFEELMSILEITPVIRRRITTESNSIKLRHPVKAIKSET